MRWLQNGEQIWLLEISRWHLTKRIIDYLSDAVIPSKLIVLNTESGDVVAKIDISGDPDDVFYDSEAPSHICDLRRGKDRHRRAERSKELKTSTKIETQRVLARDCLCLSETRCLLQFHIVVHNKPRFAVMRSNDSACQAPEHCCEDPACARSSGLMFHYHFPQTGPPSVTDDDPEPPPPGGWEINVPFIPERTPDATEMDSPLFDLNYGLPNIQLKLGDSRRNHSRRQRWHRQRRR